MPCDTKVQVEIDNTEWTKLARKKLGLPATGKLWQEQADQVTIEAGKLKAAQSMLDLDPFAMVDGMEIGNDELTITIDTKGGG